MTTTMMAVLLQVLAIVRMASTTTPPLGFCKLDNSTGVWWLRCPSQNGGGEMLTLGANHVSNNCFGPGVPDIEVCMTYDQNIKRSAYRDTTLALYGDDVGWAKNTASRLRDWGFNTAGAWSSVEMEDTGLLFAIVLDMGVDWTETEEHLFPDVFDPQWVVNVSKVAGLQCATRKSNPNLLGYFPDNELDWTGRWKDLSNSILDWFLLRATPTKGRTAAFTFLQQEYNDDIGNLSAAWGISPPVTSWAVLPDRAPFTMTRQRQTDCDAFLELVAERYFNITTTAIKAADPNHLVLGYRYYGVVEPVLVAAARWIDVVDYHAYSEDAPTSQLADIHVLTGLPVMVSEFGFRASDSGLLNTIGAGPVYNTQIERAEGYKRFATQLVALPFLVGFHMFAWVDEPGAGNGWRENSNYGLVHLDDEPYSLLTAMFTHLNPNTSAMHKVPWHPPAPTPPSPPSPPSPPVSPTQGFCSASHADVCEKSVSGGEVVQCTAGYEHVELHNTSVFVTVKALAVEVAGCESLPSGCGGCGGNTNTNTNSNTNTDVSDTNTNTNTNTHTNTNTNANTHTNTNTNTHINTNTHSCGAPTATAASLRGVIYSDGGKEGGPHLLVASTGLVSLPSNAPRQFLILALTAPIHLPPGNYWLGNQIGAESIACYGFNTEERAGCVYAQQPLDNGPAKVFPQGSVRSASSLSVYAVTA